MYVYMVYVYVYVSCIFIQYITYQIHIYTCTYRSIIYIYIHANLYTYVYKDACVYIYMCGQISLTSGSTRIFPQGTACHSPTSKLSMLWIVTPQTYLACLQAYAVHRCKYKSSPGQRVDEAKCVDKLARWSSPAQHHPTNHWNIEIVVILATYTDQLSKYAPSSCSATHLLQHLQYTKLTFDLLSLDSPEETPLISTSRWKSLRWPAKRAMI